jgi:hypothetical protein
MSEQKSNPEDSLDSIERRMAIEEALINHLLTDLRLAPEERDSLIRDIEARIERGELGNESDLDDDDFAALVRKLGPRSPQGRAGAAALPEEPFVE